MPHQLAPIQWLYFLIIFFCCLGTGVLYGQAANNILNERAEKYLAQVSTKDRTKESILLLHKALPIFRETKNWEKVVKCQNSLLTAYYYAEEFDSCSIAAEDAYNTAQQYLTKASDEYISAIANFGFMNMLKGNYQKALELNRLSRELQQEKKVDKMSLYVDYVNAAYILFTLGDFDEALSFNKKAHEAILDTLGGGTHESAYLYREMGSCHKARKAYDVAVSFYNKSIAVLDKLERKEYYDQTRWFVYVDIADIYLIKNDRTKVLNYITKAIEIQKRYNLLNDHKTWEVLGKLYQREGDYAKAIIEFKKQKQAVDKELSIYLHHPTKALAIANIASVYADMKDYNEALKQYQLALQTIAVGFNDKGLSQNPQLSQFINKADALKILEGKAAALFASYQQGNGGQAHLKAANNCYLLMAELVNAIRLSYLAEGSKHTLSEKAVSIYEHAIEVALELHGVTGQQQYLEQAFAFAEGNKAVTLYEGVRDQMAKGFAGIPDSLLEKERDLQAEIVFYEKKILESQQKLTPDATAKTKIWESKIFELKAQYNKLNELLESRYPDYFSLKYQTGPASIASIRKRLSGENTALVEFMLGLKNGYAFFLTKKELSVFVIKDRSSLEGSVQRLREIISLPPNSEHFSTDYADFAGYSHQLYTQLLGSGIAKLPQGIKRLVIIPDEVLNYLPLEVLLTEEPQGRPSFSPKQLSYLFEEYAIAYHYSATLLTNSPQRQVKLNNKTGFLGYAPSFGKGLVDNSRSCDAGQLSNLACNDKEVGEIYKLLNGKLALSSDANTAAFLKDAPMYGILHLATHACIDQSSPEMNKIFFTDAYLSQIELDQLKLRAALTVLSACNTGTGKLQHGEGVMSMARSFLLAGSASVLNSLWAVDDCATSSLMLEYYQQLKKGQPKDIALQRAKLTHLNNADVEASHPYYWAAFVQFGEVEALDFGGLQKWMLYVGLAALLLLLLFAWVKKKRATPSF